MTTYKTAHKALREAILNPNDEEKLEAAKEHPKLKSTLMGFTKKDAKVLNKVIRADVGKGRCDQ